jgi:HK97 family phage major capsid protein
MDKLKAKREERAGYLDGMQALLDAADTAKRDLSAEERTKFTDLSSKADALEAELKELEKIEEQRAKLAIEQEKRKAEILAANAGADPDVSVKAIDLNSKESKEKRNVLTFQVLKAQMGKNPEKRFEAQKALAEMGYYDDAIGGAEKRGGFNTLIDGDGAVLLPTSVTNEIMDIMQNYGVVPRLALNLGDISQNNVKVPQILGRPSFSAVSQGGAISGSGFGLGAIELKALKWGAIINWTNEVSDSVAARLMPIIMDKVAEGYAYVQDDAFFNGTGTSTYNGIKGLEGLTGTVNYVRTATAASGNNTFATLDADDFILPQLQVAPGARSGAVYVMHPNLIHTLRRLKTTAGDYIYGMPSESAPVGNLFGYRIETSEAFAFTDGATKTVCAFFNPRYLAYATGRNLTADQLVEGSIVDEDSNTINLATTDQKALRFTGLFDLVLSSVTRTTAGTAQGAFSVLRTNS